MSWEDEIVMRDVTNAGLVVSDRIGREVASQPDLEESLEASRYASHPYSAHPKEWPSLVEVVDTRELPPVLIERYNAAGGEGTALCGIFPEIRRAWASVDNSLFLWRFDKWDGQCPEYSGEEQAICAVGLAKSKPGVFVEAIQYLLILATPVELILVGVCCSGGTDGSDPFSEVSLQSLPDHTVPSDGVTMTCVACTDKGRIFLAGRDGHIYELLYSTGSGWQKRCRKVCLTAGLGSVISRWVIPNVFNFGAVDPIVEMVFDNERQILFARTEDMKLQVYVLGSNGDGSLKKVAEEKNIVNQRDAHYGGRQSTGQRNPSRSPKPTIVCISPLSTLESKWLHLLVVLSDGRRMYLSTSPSSGSLSGFNTILYNDTGFTVNKVEYEGSLLCVGNLLLSWKPKKFSEITSDSLSIFQILRPIPEILIIGSGRDIQQVDPELRRFIRSTGMKLEAVDSRNAASTYNILNEEGRIVAAALLPYGVTS